MQSHRSTRAECVPFPRRPVPIVVSSPLTTDGVPRSVRAVEISCEPNHVLLWSGSHAPHVGKASTMELSKHKQKIGMKEVLTRQELCRRLRRISSA